MWQLTDDVKNEKSKANLFVDEWPKFTTLVAQEITPRISTVNSD